MTSAQQSWFFCLRFLCDIFPFFFYYKPDTRKLHAPSGHFRQNVIYFDLAHGVTTTLTPNLLFGGQVISSEPKKHRSGEENDKKLIEQTNYVKWSGVADTLYQFTLQQTRFALSLCCAWGYGIHQLFGKCMCLIILLSLLNIFVSKDWSHFYTFVVYYIVCSHYLTLPQFVPPMCHHKIKKYPYFSEKWKLWLAGGTRGKVRASTTSLEFII